MRFAEKRGHHRHGEQQQQPRLGQQQHAGERDQRDEVLCRPQQQREQADAADGLAAGALEMIVDLGVLELGDIERGGVPHEAHAQPVGEQIAEQALEQGREPRQSLAHHGDAQF